MENIIFIAIDKLEPHPSNPRKEYRDLEELAGSIKAKGVMQNLTVVKNEDKYRVVIGHRRLAASKMAGLTELPCVVVEMTEKEQVETMLLENMQRSDLTIIEQAEGFQMMMDLGESVKSVAEHTGVSEKTIKHRIKLLELDQNKLKESMDRGGSIMDYIELEKIKSKKTKDEILQYIGTDDFKWRLQRALNSQEEEAKMAKYKKALNGFATYIADYRNYEPPEGKELEYVCSYSIHNSEDVKVYDDGADYFYATSWKGYDLYRLIDSPEEQEETPDDKLEELKERAADINHRLEEVAKVTDTCIADFIKKIGKVTYQGLMATLKLATKYIVNEDCSYFESDQFLELSGISIDDEEDEFDYLTDNKLVKQFIEYNPEKAFITAVVLSSSASVKRYFGNQYYNELRLYSYTTNEEMDEMYKVLQALGYKLCDVEKKLKDGTLELFQEAEDLFAEYEAYSKEQEELED